VAVKGSGPKRDIYSVYSVYSIYIYISREESPLLTNAEGQDSGVGGDTLMDEDA